MLSALFFCCYGIYFPIFVNYWNFGHNGMTAISNHEIKHKQLTSFLSTFHLFFSRVFSFQTLSLYLLLDTSYTCSHTRNSSIFHAFFEDKNRQHVLHTNAIVWWRRRNRNRAGTDRFGPIPSHQSFSGNTEL